MILHLGDSKDEGNNPGLTYTTLPWTMTLGEAGRNDTLPMEYLDSAFYFVARTFPSGIAQLPEKVNVDDYYETVKLR
jgi:hypothetical protein